MNRIIIILAFLLFISACEEDVVLNLAEIQKKLVVEAVISNSVPFAKVSLSYSEGFYDTISISKIIDATVEIISESGNLEQLSLSLDGIYFSKLLQPEFGKKYTLKIQNGEQTIESTTTLMPPVKIKQVLQVPNPFYQTTDSINLFVTVDDPKGEDNFFRLKINKIGTVSHGDYYFVDDSYGKDGVISMPVYYKNYTFGDTVIVELLQTTRDISDYYSGLNDNVRGSFNSIAPGNPVSNMPDDVYGLFAAYGIDRDTVIIGSLTF